MQRLHDRIDRLEKALVEAIELAESLAEDTQYGFPHAGCDPKDFEPDLQSCHPEEIAAHKAALEAGEPNPGGHHCDVQEGRVIAAITMAPWGIGVVTYRDADMAARAQRWKEALAGAQPPIVSAFHRKAFTRLLERIGSWTDARWDQHLRQDVGDEHADVVIAAVQRFVDHDAGVPRRFDLEVQDGGKKEA